MKVRWKQSTDPTIEGHSGKLNTTILKIKRFLANKVFLFENTRNNNFYSGNFFPSNWSRRINNSSADVVNIHWVGGETMSIEDIGRIAKPIVWSLHDMWTFVGSEHIADYSADARWRSGFPSPDDSVHHSMLDIDRYVWLRKYNNWKNPIHIVAPSKWLADCARESTLLKHHPVTVIPNVLDTDLFHEQNMNESRKALGLPIDKKIILFGSIGGTWSHNKGFDLLLNALQLLEKRFSSNEILCVVFGQNEKNNEASMPFSSYWTGHINNDSTLCHLYNSADLTVVPSRQESFGQVASEALSCACPVVAFDSTGLKDIVDHLENGYLAKAFDAADLAEGICWILEDPERRTVLGESGRKKALASWSADIVIPKYLGVFQRACRL